MEKTLKIKAYCFTLKNRKIVIAMNKWNQELFLQWKKNIQMSSNLIKKRERRHKYTPFLYEMESKSDKFAELYVIKMDKWMFS